MWSLKHLNCLLYDGNEKNGIFSVNGSRVLELLFLGFGLWESWIGMDFLILGGEN